MSPVLVASLMSSSVNMFNGSGMPGPSLASSQPQGVAASPRSVQPKHTPSTVTTVLS